MRKSQLLFLIRDVRDLRIKEIRLVKIKWKHHSIEELTWETEWDMQNQYPHLFEDPELPFS